MRWTSEKEDVIMRTMSQHKILLLGGGFAGTWIATHAHRYVSHTTETTLISAESLFTFSPLLINGLAGDLVSHDFTIDLPTLAKRHGFTFLQGIIQHIDRTGRLVHVQEPNGHTIQLPYDTAVLTTGAESNFFGMDGLQTHAFTLKHLSDVQRLVAHLNETLTRASTMWTEEEKKKELSFLVVGGGPTGVEILGAMKERLKRCALTRGLEALLPLVNITLIESNSLLFYGFPKSLSEQSKNILIQGGVDIRCGVRVIHVQKNQATLSDGSIIPYGTLLWTAGVRSVAPPIQPPFHSARHLRRVLLA